MNEKIISNFGLLIDSMYLEKPPNYSFKVNSFRKTIDIIKNLDFDIKNVEQIKDIKGIGKGTLDRITEIIDNGTLKNNSILTISDDFKLLQTITGIGPAKAKNLIEKNITFNNLINNPSLKILNELTHHQKLGIKYYYDLQKKIPREIITSFIHILQKYDIDFTICGSYRREKPLSSDIDVLVLEKEHTLKYIIDKLKKNNILVDDLTTEGSTKYMGIAKIPNFNQFLRIDIRLISKKSFPFAVLYFTGSKKTNTYMRNIAIKSNLKLSEYHLLDKTTDKPIYLSSEKAIFKYLNIPYIEPNQR
tara:strand:+ start:1186 stop:2097 length:912 start_codon:yes stop_codon:yes gene_type:complete